MNREMVSKALSQIDEDLIAEAFRYQGGHGNVLPERYDKMTKKEKRIGWKRVPALALAACMLLMLAAAAYAANLWGIREMWRISGRELPEEALPLVRQRNETGAGEDWSAAITETLCDGNTAVLTLTVSGGERYIIAPTDAMPEDTVEVIGLEGTMTLAEYCAQQGKALLLVGASLPYDELGIAHQSEVFQNLSDSDMVILIRAEKGLSVEKAETHCTVYALESGSQEVQRVEIPLTLTWEAQAETVLTPRNPDAVPGLHIGEAVISESALGINVTFPVVAEDEAALYKVWRMDCDEIADFEGGMIRDDDGIWRVHWSMGQGRVTDELTVHFYGEGDTLIGNICFR